MEYGKTIKQIADELGVSKQAVHQKRKSKRLSATLQPFTETIDGVVYIAPEGELILRQAFSKQENPRPSTVDDNGFIPVYTNVDASEHPLYAILKAELDAKNRQIEQLQEELAMERKRSHEQAAEMAKLLDQEQQLHAGTIRRLAAPEETEQLVETETAAAVEESVPAEPERKTFGRWIRSIFG